MNTDNNSELAKMEDSILLQSKNLKILLMSLQANYSCAICDMGYELVGSCLERSQHAHSLVFAFFINPIGASAVNPGTQSWGQPIHTCWRIIVDQTKAEDPQTIQINHDNLQNILTSFFLLQYSFLCFQRFAIFVRGCSNCWCM